VSDKLEPELERVAQMLAQAGPLPNAPATLRERVLTIPEGEVSPAEAAAPDEAPIPLARRAWRRRPGPLVLTGIAATVIAIAIVPVVALEGGSQATAKRIDLSPRSFAPEGGGAAQVVPHRDGSATITLTVWKMPKPGYDRTYEAWLGRKGDRLALGTFGTDPKGKATITLNVPPGELENYRWLWVTSEPKGGSHTPSRSTALWGPLA
jgi:anti-sigma-K factor RskA